MTAPDPLAQIRARLAAYTQEPCNPSEKSMKWATATGGCGFCDRRVTEGMPAIDRICRPMIVCTECGNKRCPKASWHGNICTGNNTPGQGGNYPMPLSAAESLRMLAALDAVMALHTGTCEMSGENCEADDCPMMVCGPCGETWPCPAVAAVSAALGGGE